ncbi:UNVERIFIED_CONTAM: hypothetical protein FKN15_074675 [Acipenser sinensis]
MAGVFIVFTALLLCLPDFSVGIKVRQSPHSLFESPGRSPELQCSHDASSNQYMYWYQQTRKGALELIGYLSYETPAYTVLQITSLLYNNPAYPQPSMRLHENTSSHHLLQTTLTD